MSNIESDFEGIYEATGIMNQEGFIFYHAGCKFYVIEEFQVSIIEFSAHGWGDDFGVSISELGGAFSKPVKDLEGECHFNLEEDGEEDGVLKFTIKQDGVAVGEFKGISEGLDFTAIIDGKGKLKAPRTVAHHNKFIFKGIDTNNDINDIKFLFNNDDTSAYSITKGQPWKEVNVMQKDHGSTLIVDIDAGRKGDSSNADFFNDTVNSDGNNMIHTDGGSNKPSELNFAIKGVLEINGDRFNVCLGQGHRSSNDHNNWHLASESLSADKHQKNGNLGSFHLAQNGTHQFDVSLK
ncbi:hypothetical protein [Alteromonas sp. a30]|uniref:hypothetical protein n=1 Tax=Alteromonas sp. a30 TaxID=2730917 RepID=UPI00227EA568|nr:hypothetical protein [Alteromonas sp. a30]MCY7296898.1 hypothetical protein [Alteromonas sp. a30]